MGSRRELLQRETVHEEKKKLVIMGYIMRKMS